MINFIRVKKHMNIGINGCRMLMIMLYAIMVMMIANFMFGRNVPATKE